MKITVIGTGYVGLVTGTCFSDMGNEVWCVDIDEAKISALNKGIIPIYEPELTEIVLDNYEQGRLHFVTDLKAAITQAQVCFIAVGTPMGEDGSADLQYVLGAARQIGACITHHIVIVDKSTVPVGTAAKVRAAVQEELNKRGSDLTFDVVSNPEFLKEGSAVSDCMKPDRIVIGVESDIALDVMRELYTPFVKDTEKFHVMDIKSAEMTKYTANAMLATKISFMNEIANICERVGADVNMVRLGIGSDSRIGYSFIYPGCGYGGSCFPKDVTALIHFADEVGYATPLLNAVTGVNDAQKHVLCSKVIERFGKDLSGLTFAVWGLAFKPDTDDMRESAAITIIKDLTALGAKIVAYDPKALKEAEFYLKAVPNVTYVRSKYKAVADADAMLLVTEWKEFRSPDFEEMKTHMKQRIIFDGRNQYDAEHVKKHGFEYYQIGVGK